MLFRSSPSIEVSPIIQDIGVDEVYADLTSIEGDSYAIAARIKSAVFEATGLTCSVGVAPNKLLAKLSSDMQKPDGITVLVMDDIATRIWPMPARRINGIGPKAAAKLASLRIPVKTATHSGSKAPANPVDVRHPIRRKRQLI